MRRWILLIGVSVALLLGLLLCADGAAEAVSVTARPAHTMGALPGLLDAEVPITAPLMLEGFEGIFPPAGWLAMPLTGGGEWVPLSAMSAPPIPPHGGTLVAGHPFSSFESADSWLVTSLVTPTASSELVFWEYVRYIQDYRFHGVYIGMGRQDPKYGDFTGPGTGALLAEIVPAVEDAWHEVRLSLAGYAGQPVYIAFRYTGLNGDVWAVDDVAVTTGVAVGSDSPTPLGEMTTLTATVAPGRTAVFAWDLGDGTLAAGPVVTHTYASVGRYTAVVTASNSSSLVVASTTVRVVTRVFLPLVMRP